MPELPSPNPIQLLVASFTRKVNVFVLAEAIRVYSKVGAVFRFLAHGYDYHDHDYENELQKVVLQSSPILGGTFYINKL